MFWWICPIQAPWYNITNAGLQAEDNATSNPSWSSEMRMEMIWDGQLSPSVAKNVSFFKLNSKASVYILNDMVRLNSIKIFLHVCIYKVGLLFMSQPYWVEVDGTWTKHKLVWPSLQVNLTLFLEAFCVLLGHFRLHYGLQNVFLRLTCIDW